MYIYIRMYVYIYIHFGGYQETECMPRALGRPVNDMAQPALRSLDRRPDRSAALPHPDKEACLPAKSRLLVTSTQPQPTLSPDLA